jgi:hypothetical protein
MDDAPTNNSPDTERVAFDMNSPDIERVAFDVNLNQDEPGSEQVGANDMQAMPTENADEHNDEAGDDDASGPAVLGPHDGSDQHDVEEEQPGEHRPEADNRAEVEVPSDPAQDEGCVAADEQLRQETGTYAANVPAVAYDSLHGVSFARRLNSREDLHVRLRQAARSASPLRPFHHHAEPRCGAVCRWRLAGVRPQSAALSAAHNGALGRLQ